MANNAIQNVKTLSKCDKHNYRKYNNEQEQIVIVKGTSSFYKDVEVFIKLNLKKLDQNIIISKEKDDFER